MKYLIVQDWNSTHGNHAGMVHMCKLLCCHYPNFYKMIVMEDPSRPQRSNFILSIYRKIINKLFFNRLWLNKYKSISSSMLNELSKDDEVFLLEYMLPSVPQYPFAKYLRSRYPSIKLYALSHLTPTYFEDPARYPQLIKKWKKPIDKFLTLGTSLSDYFVLNGISKEKISTGFHYVDKEYYSKKIEDIRVSDKPKVITMGNMQRDFSLLFEIVKLTPNVDWIICKGRKNVDSLFAEFTNVTLKGYMEEDDLKEMMNVSDISLNVMSDTVGSNVITTSLAMGLAMVVSDVGSIRDYCSEDNTIFCKNTAESFSEAINQLIKDKKKIYKMKLSALEKSTSLNISKVSEWFGSI